VNIIFSFFSLIFLCICCCCGSFLFFGYYLTSNFSNSIGEILCKNGILNTENINQFYESSTTENFRSKYTSDEFNKIIKEVQSSINICKDNNFNLIEFLSDGKNLNYSISTNQKRNLVINLIVTSQAKPITVEIALEYLQNELKIEDIKIINKTSSNSK